VYLALSWTEGVTNHVVVLLADVFCVVHQESHSELVDVVVVQLEHQRQQGVSCELTGLTNIGHHLRDHLFEVEHSSQGR